MSEKYGARLSTLRFSGFRGVDLSSPPANIAPSRSPSAPNMLPDLSGRPVKRPGYSLFQTYPAAIYGVFKLRVGGTLHRVVHSGTGLYLDDPQGLVFSSMAEQCSFAKQYGSCLWVSDGTKLRVLKETASGWEVKSASESAYVPTVTISRNPSGGGTDLEPFNLIGRRFTEDFSGDGSSAVYQLSYAELDESISVKVLSSASTAQSRLWTALTENTDYTVNRTSGKVTFVTAPAVSPITGEDNVSITAGTEIEGYPERIDKCRVSELFGIGGAENRLFLTANPDYPGIDWHSDMDNLYYFPENAYSDMAGGRSDFIGYSRLGDKLVTHSAAAENDCTAFVRGGSLSSTGEAVFPLENVLHGPGAVSSFGFGSLGDEPLFLTEKGVYALTSADSGGEKYLQSRSYFIDKALTAESNLSTARLCQWRNFMLVSAGTRIYLLDGRQKSYDAKAPFSTFQYECYYFENVPAAVVWEEDGTLFFGGFDGKLYSFHTENSYSDQSYYDCGTAINAHWELPEISGGSFFCEKTLRGVYVKLEPQPHTSVTVKVKFDGVWNDLWSERRAFSYFRWSALKWSEFVWRTDDGPRNYGARRRISSLDKLLIRFENNENGEPFGLYEAGVELGEGKIKAY